MGLGGASFECLHRGFIVAPIRGAVSGAEKGVIAAPRDRALAFDAAARAEGSLGGFHSLRFCSGEQAATGLPLDFFQTCLAHKPDRSVREKLVFVHATETDREPSLSFCGKLKPFSVAAIAMPKHRIAYPDFSFFCLTRAISTNSSLRITLAAGFCARTPRFFQFRTVG